MEDAVKRIFLIVFLLTSVLAYADGTSKGQVIIIPIYSHIYTGDNQREFLLTATAVFRNIDQRTPVTLVSADYYGSDGKLIKKYLKSPSTVAPLSSMKFIVNESDKAGGSGASIVVKWQSSKPVTPPITGAVMIGAKSQQGISFTSEGKVIGELR